MATQNQQDYEAQRYQDLDGQGIKFAETNIRLGFIKKVYAILSVQLFATAFFCFLVYQFPALLEFQKSNLGLGLLILSAVILIVVGYALFCYRSVARTVPTNYILLGLYTMAEAYALPYTCTQFPTEKVLLALALTAGIVVTLTIYACTTKTDFTICGGLLFIAGFAVFALGIAMIFLRGNKHFETMYLVYNVIGACLAGLYLIYDTQLVVGGGQYELSIDDYILGALIIYIDIIVLFIRILRILGKK
jgi:FtsH-binding integral membrane protein